MVEIKLDENIDMLPKGKYLQIAVEITAVDNLIVRSSSSEEVLTFMYPELGNRFIIPWRKIKGKLRRYTLEKQRSLGIFEKCHLKDGLCLQCPTCLLFGATGETNAKAAEEYKKNVKDSYNLASRVLGETFISKNEIEEIMDYTANAVDEVTHTTGQALMTKIFVPAGTKFRGVVTIRDPTPEMASIVVDNINRMTRLGAETRDWGRIRTKILGIKYSDRETISSIDLINDETLKSLEPLDTLKIPKVDNSYSTLAQKFITALLEYGLIKENLLAKKG